MPRSHGYVHGRYHIRYYHLRALWKRYTMVKTPCQQIVWDVLPAIRAALAAELVRNSISQQEVARLLDMAPSAVSQYLSGKRGYRIVFEGLAQRRIEDLARDIKAGGVTDITARICAICHEVRDDHGPCLPVKEAGS
jgi:predicted transcriptional regulator